MHQGIGAGVGLYPLVDMDIILNKPAERRGRHFLLLLDNILDPHNFGALVRTADCVGIDGIIMPKDRSAPPSPAVSKASSGALEHVLLARVTNMVSTIKELKRQGIWIVGMDRDADQSLFRSDLTDSIAIIIGGEEKGIRPLVKKNCDFLVSIPHAGRVESLNASAAGAVVMYEAFRQRTLSKSEARNPK
jgi:23S rRNA (guanosine2251-2'-O)-methyltransferase